MLEIVPQGEPELWLRKQLLVDGDLPTVAGVLLFADEPQTVLPKASIKIYRYRTSGEASRDVLVADPETIEGCVYRQVYDAVGRVQSLVESIPTMSKDGLQLQRYPGVTIHEIITNAVLHRDYSVQDDIHVRIFDNRIEVESPGRLPAHITSENILSERFARNPTVVRLINKFPDPPNKDVGEGLNSAFEAMRRLRLKPPQIVETDHSVLVHIRHEKLASPGQQIMEFLGEHDEIRNRQAREITGIGSENEMKRIFQRMMKAGEIESIPGRSRPLSAYRIAGADSVMSDANLDSG